MKQLERAANRNVTGEGGRESILFRRLYAPTSDMGEDSTTKKEGQQ